VATGGLCEAKKVPPRIFSLRKQGFHANKAGHFMLASLTGANATVSVL
jgi:hypothetical protein